MGFQDLAFDIPALLSTCCTVFLGGLFVVISWATVADISLPEGTRRASVALWALFVAVALDLIVFPVMWAVPNEDWFHDLPLYQAVWSGFLLLSFVAQVLCAATAHRGAISARKTLRIGSALTLVGNALCFALYLLAQPGMPLH